MSEAPEFLTASPLPRLLFFGGKGGVGKTTCAVATALHLVERRSAEAGSVLLVSTDPAHSLQDSLAGAPPPRGLEVVELRAKERLDDFERRHGEQLRQIADRGTFLDAEDIDRFLSLSLPGMDELVAFLDLAKWAEEGTYDCMVVDTAPTGHTLRLLAMPELLRRWVEVLDALLAKHRYMRQLFGRSAAPDALDRFLEQLGGSISSAEALFRDRARCRFVPVMVAEELSVRETRALLRELDRHGIAADEIVVNKLAPANGCPVCADTREHQLQRLREQTAALAPRSLWGLPLHAEEVRGAQLLGALWSHVRRIPAQPASEAPRAAGAGTGTGRPSAPPPRVESPAPPPAPDLDLLFFAGKGGVGKTTLACATAMRLAERRRRGEQQVLLFSTDPAHSLADCLGVPVGAEPTAVTDGLAAMQIDAEAELASLKEQYRLELDEFLASALKNLDAPFDREVIEKLLDLSPPGLDEIMALARAMKLLDQKTYGPFILDSAPTGHLLRLLELPEVVDQWLKAFFELLLKYRRVFHVPALAERLVELSKALHRFRALLKDPRRSGLAAVSILTQMALEETTDLVAACERMQVSVPTIFFNMATPPSECAFCRARARQEAQVREAFLRGVAGPRNRTVIYWQPEPRGLERIEELGRALYRAPPEGLRGGADG